ncbi:LRRC74B [Symbiodinium microadriaticum]|nr:LRRC74B [Symbiodinium sp. KB8]CAE7547650.1 LRRC74B [Symbiodinium microadriaticum]
MAASWLKQRKELAILLAGSYPRSPNKTSQPEHSERRLRKGLSRILAVRDEVRQNSQHPFDESDAEFFLMNEYPGVAGGDDAPMDADMPKQEDEDSGLPLLWGEAAGQSLELESDLFSNDADLTGSHGQSPGTKSHATSMSRTVSPSFAAGVLRSRRVSVDLTQPVPNTDGEVIDFLERRRMIALGTFIVKMWTRSVLTGDVVVPARAELKLITQVLQLPDPDETAAVSDCRFLIMTEELAAVIAHTVTVEKKKLPAADGGYLPTPKNQFKEWASYLAEVSVSCREMQKQVSSWVSRYERANDGSFRETPREHSFEHRVRVVDFWYEYHKDAWNTLPLRHGGGRSRTPGGSSGKASSGAIPYSTTLSRQPSLRRTLTKSDPALQLSKSGSGLLKLPPVSNPARERYLKQCSGRTMTPLPIPFMIGETPDLDLARLDLSDVELEAIAETLPTVHAVRKVDLHGNALLSDRSLSNFLRSVQLPRLASSLVELSLSGCSRAGPQSLACIISLVSDASYIERLDLSQVEVNHRYQLPLCEAISERQTLNYVNLSRTSMGSGPIDHGCQCIATLLQGHVQELDLSWNHMSSQLFQCLGENIARQATVKKLNVCNCSGAGIDHLSVPVNFFVEQLRKDNTLTSLDLSMSRMNFRSALILEDALQNHKQLKHLYLADNPLGPRGLRSVLRTIASTTNALKFFDTSGCYGGEVPADHDREVFAMSNLPGAGSYHLQLHRPYHRSLLRMLCKSAEGFRLAPSEVLLVVSSSDDFVHGTKKGGLWEVPNSGEVTLSFDLERCFETPLFKDVDSDFGLVINRFYSLSRFHLDSSKAVAVFGRFVELDGFQHSQACLLKALSFDFVLTISHLKVLAETSQLFRAPCIMNLLPSVLCEPGSYYVAQGMYATTLDCVTCRLKLKQLLSFTVRNPTGHYELALDNRADFAVAEQLALLDKWEIMMDKRLGREDVSAECNRSHARNAFYQGKPILTSSMAFADWKRPGHDKLELDYVSSHGPPKGAQAITWPSLCQILEAVHQPACMAHVKVAALRSQAQSFCIESRQLRVLVGTFSEPADRIEMFVLFFNRVVDPQNAKMYKAQLEDFSDVMALRRRLGFARTFPYIQPEFDQFQLDLRLHDERVCMTALLALSARENAGNIRHPVYVLPDGTVDPLKMGIPRSWEFLDRVPQAGQFKCSYVCAPGQRNFELRKQLCKTYHFSDVKETAVSWWTNMIEVPSEVIDLVLMLKESGVDLNKAFDSIDGFDGNGEIGLGKLQQGLEDLGWRRFKNPSSDNEMKEQILAIFRCVNVSGHGTLSRSDWNILQQLTKDVDHAIAEFVQYLMRIYGSMPAAWAALDVDVQESLGRKAWIEGLRQLGYFGPGDIVFRFLTASDASRARFITWQKFCRLEKFTSYGLAQSAA